MFEEKYEKLNTTEKENSKRIINLLLGKTFIVNRIYDAKQAMFKGNADYRFVDRNLEMFKEFFAYAGFRLQKDSNYEVIYIENEFAYNKARLDKTTTIFLYALRLKFDEDRESIKLNSDTIVSVADIIKTLLDVGAYAKKPTDNDIRASLSKLIHFNIIQKIEGQLENPETKIVILPSILFAVTNEKISSIANMIEKDANSQSNAEFSMQSDTQSMENSTEQANTNRETTNIDAQTMDDEDNLIYGEMEDEEDENAIEDVTD